VGAALVVVGDKLGLYRAIAETGSATPVEFAARTETAERYVANGWHSRRPQAIYDAANEPTR
jgi:hypothetical protein